MTDLRKAADLYHPATFILIEGLKSFGIEGERILQKWDQARRLLDDKALAQPEQEPVAFGFQNTAITESNRWMMLRETIPADDQYQGALWTPLYTAPPKREWVDLTDEEIDSVDGVEMKYIGSGEYVIEGEYEFARAILAKAKEKNT